MPVLAPRRRARRLLLAPLLLAAAAAAACSGRVRPAPISVQLQGVPRILRVPPDLVRDAAGTPLPIRPGYADAFYGITAPALERWGLDLRLVVEPAYVAALILRASQYDTLAVYSSLGPDAAALGPTIGLAQLSPGVDAELRAAAALPQFAWMAAEVNAWPRDPAIHPAQGTPQGAAAVRARIADGSLTAQREYLLGSERSARAAMFWVKVLHTRWTTDVLPGAYGSFARQALANGNAPSDEQILNLVTVSYRRGHAWTRAAVERLGPTWATRLRELGAEGADAADYLERSKLYLRLLGGDPSAYQQPQQRRPT